MRLRPPRSVVVADGRTLADFRQGLTGAYAFNLLDQAGGRLLVQLAVGVGKSQWLTRIIEHNMGQDQRYDLIVALFPRWDIVNEVKALLPPALDCLVLRPRPRRRCGALDREWQSYEQAGCGLLGRADLCGQCPRRRTCFWPKQYGKALDGVRLILTVQHHIELDPQFIRRLQRDTQAQKPLVLLDESALLLKDREQVIKQQDMHQFIVAAKQAGGDGSVKTMNKWINFARLAVTAPTADLQGGQWRSPFIAPAWAVAVQHAGREQFGDGFRFIGFNLQHFAWSDPASRERLPNGDLRFAVPPSLGKQFIVFSGSIAQKLVRYRLDPNHRWPDISSPFENIEFSNPGTRWFNISSMIGAACYFERNASGILDFFAAKIARNIDQGTRTLLIAKKRFRPYCAEYLSKRLREQGINVRIVTGNWNRVNLDDPRTLPLINYGVSGVNRFQDFDAAYCLTAYYANEAVVAKTIHDIDASSDRFPITIRTLGCPVRRGAHVELPDDRVTILPAIAQGVLDQLEADVVVQAVGRVRPFTRPREIITFHVGQLPGVQYTFNFDNLRAARAYFGISTSRTARRDSQIERAQQLAKMGFSVSEIARQLNVHAKTVRRYLRH